MNRLPPADDEDAAELTALRIRAYGPDPDIASDPDAQARLDELERDFAENDRAVPDDEAPAGSDEA
jgi:hypothetical protein